MLIYCTAYFLIGLKGFYYQLVSFRLSYLWMGPYVISCRSPRGVPCHSLRTGNPYWKQWKADSFGSYSHVIAHEVITCRWSVLDTKAFNGASRLQLIAGNPVGSPTANVKRSNFQLLMYIICIMYITRFERSRHFVSVFRIVPCTIEVLA